MSDPVFLTKFKDFLVWPCKRLGLLPSKPIVNQHSLPLFPTLSLNLTAFPPALHFQNPHIHKIMVAIFMGLQCVLTYQVYSGLAYLFIFPERGVIYLIGGIKKPSTEGLIYLIA